MNITVKLFASLRDQAGWSVQEVDVPNDSTVGSLLGFLTEGEEDLNLATRPVYVAVNSEYAQPDTVLSEHDEVAIFPPVSGGNAKSEVIAEGANRKLFEITTDSLSLDDVAQRVSRPTCGAITTFAGIVRGETRVRGKIRVREESRGTDFLEYEAYVEMAESKLAQIGAEIQDKWPSVAAVSILHRIGRCEVGESSVVIAVATPHRGDGCFEACRYAIERLKAIVPIWKQENWADGQVWIEGPRQPDLDVSPVAPSDLSA